MIIAGSIVILSDAKDLMPIATGMLVQLP